MTNDMGLTPTDFTGFPGSPFTQNEIDAAVDAVRSAAGWHIAPEKAETISMDVDWCERVLRPPTKHLVSVEEIRDTKLSTVIAADRYEVSTTWAAIHRCGGTWPAGYNRVEIDITHGYSTVPKDLLPVFAEAMAVSRRDQTANQYGAGPFSVTYGAADAATRTMNPLSSASVLERYSLWQMGMA